MKQKNFRRGFVTLLSIFILTMFSMTAMAVNARWESTTSRDENNNICIDFAEVQVILPSDWAGKVQMNISTNSVSFYHIASRDLWTEYLGYANGGWLFSITYTEDSSYEDTEPSYMTIGTVGDGFYYASFPTDLQAYTYDEDTYNEYVALSDDMEWVKTNMFVTVSEDILISEDEYIIAESSSAYLSESDLEGMTADEVQMAINEIYARHHRKFLLDEVQEYFDSKSWYTGTVEAEDFDVSVMNTYEGYNINLMVEYLSKLNSESDDSNITIETASTADAYGMIIESNDGYFRIRLSDGSSIQFWYEYTTISDAGLTVDDLAVGAVTSLIYDTESYEILSILIW